MLELSFKIEKRTLNETAFFRRLTQDRIPIAPVLRRLMTAYLNAHSAAVEAKGIFRQLWGPEGQGALAPAMQALLSIDPDSHDIFRSYLAKRNGEYDVYSTDVIMKRYIQKSGWRNIAMIGFGIYFALIRHKDGLRAIRGGLLNEYGLLSAAEKTVSEATFAAMISQEIDQFMVDPGLDYGTKEDLYVSIQPSLELTKYGRRVLGFLSFGEKLNLKRGPEKHGWNPGFLQAVDAQRARAEKAARPWWTYVFRKNR
ncbi:hypothetical protein [Mesorhizobium huakuii]|uniref:Uncharacterized protein n=1 Tax=Mesorhizobium huakuii TaxID=28104 RepID=A0A7G6T0E3_9HYPH|nr:hypothetical protein [Mesorhizobium huakuii]QND60225.1 hypothetical protein HB778_29510 [Mesorhizobium huakuii]